MQQQHVSDANEVVILNNLHPPYTCLCVHVVVEELLLVELKRGRDGERPRPPVPPAATLVLLPKLVLLS